MLNPAMNGAVAPQPPALSAAPPTNDWAIFARLFITKQSANEEIPMRKMALKQTIIFPEFSSESTIWLSRFHCPSMSVETKLIIKARKKIVRQLAIRLLSQLIATSLVVAANPQAMKMGPVTTSNAMLNFAITSVSTAQKITAHKKTARRKYPVRPNISALTPVAEVMPAKFIE